LQAASDEERVVGQRTWTRRSRALNKHPSTCIYSDLGLFPGWQVANEIAESISFNTFQQFIN